MGYPNSLKKEGSDSARGYCSFTGENDCPLSYLVTTLDQTHWGMTSVDDNFLRKLKLSDASLSDILGDDTVKKIKLE